MELCARLCGVICQAVSSLSLPLIEVHVRLRPADPCHSYT